MTHSFTRKVLKWEFCAKCGLVTLNNPRSTKATLRDCPGPREAQDLAYGFVGSKYGNADRVWSSLKAKGWK